MKIFLLSLLGVALSAGTLFAQEVPEDQMPTEPALDSRAAGKAPDLAHVVAHLQGNFAGITSFTYSERRRQSNEADWSLCWKEMGERYWFENTCGKIDDIMAFDGTRRSTVSRPHGGFIEVQNGPHQNGLKPWNLPSPLDLYSFLRVDDRFLSENELRPDSALWRSLSARLTYAGTRKFAGRDCEVLRVSSSYCGVKKGKADYDVYFDAQSWMPVGWQAFDSNKFMIEQFKALDFKTATDAAGAKSFVYPYHCLVTEYQWPGTLTGPHGVIKFYKGVRDLQHDGVTINRLLPADLQIDPALAKAILDEDTNVITQLSH